jgi:hypothetical protein
VAWEKPVIATNIPIFASMFERYGDIGYLFQSETELKKIVENIVEGIDKPHYNRQVLNLRKARSARMPAALAATYRTICDKVLEQY